MAEKITKDEIIVQAVNPADLEYDQLLAAFRISNLAMKDEFSVFTTQRGIHDSFGDELSRRANAGKIGAWLKNHLLG